MTKSTNGVKDPSSKDYAEWRILYALKLLHYADKNKLVNYCGISPESCSLALNRLSRNKYINGGSQSQDNVNEFM